MKEGNLHNLRHSVAHLLAAAVVEMYKGTRPTIGPPIESGFYYDFEFPSPVSEDDLPKIEKKMRELLPTWNDFTRREVTMEEAKKLFASNHYKLELIDELAATEETITIYTSGNFTDLCRGGHVEQPNQEITAFKLLSIAGAYWRGSEKNAMLTRIYGTAFPTQAELDDYMKMREEAAKRDHKKLGKELDLFIFSDLVGAGLPLWTPHGTIVRELLDDFVWRLRETRGYQKVEIPHITKKELYQTSGHWDKFSTELFRITTREGHDLAMKPMNCPHHTQLYARRQWSYRELPQRYATTTMCYRDEQTGELNGLARLRAFTQDDSHVFCSADQTKNEITSAWDIIDAFYGAFGFALQPRISLHDPRKPEKYLGTSEIWERAEDMLRSIASKRGVGCIEAVGEAAFYGPKIDFMLKDALNREWQVGTIQLDFNMPERFNLTAVSNTGEKERVVMIHIAIMGAIERFLSLLIEHSAGAFPLWLAPAQIRIVPVGKQHLGHVQKLAAFMSEETQTLKHPLRIEIDKSDETVGYKIRAAAALKIPYTLVIGDKEIASDGTWNETNAIAVRQFGSKNSFSLSLGVFLEKIIAEIESKQIRTSAF